jgi:hypothetical protein
MAKTRGTGLLMVWADIDPEFEAEYHRWYDEEHIAHLLAVPGFLSAGRYVALKGGPKYLALYELEAPDVLPFSTFVERCHDEALHVEAGAALPLLNGAARSSGPHQSVEQTAGPASFRRWADRRPRDRR